MNHVVEVQNLVKEYKNIRAVDGLSFDVREGEILGLLGPNGSGKSTTINCILSLLRCTAGEIRVFGKPMKPDAYALKAQIGVVFQDVAVFEELTVRDNIDYFCGLYIRSKAERQAAVEDAIRLVGLEEFVKFRPKQLSGGLLRRLNIACGIAHRPRLIFLDEPTVAVDPQSRNHILDSIRKLRDGGATVVYTTHYMEEVELLCDRVMILDKGKLLAAGTCDELKALARIEEKVTASVTNLSGEALERICGLPHVDKADYNDGQLVVTYRRGTDNVGRLIGHLNSEQLRYSRIYAERPTLNDVFLELTGKELRD